MLKILYFKSTQIESKWEIMLFLLIKYTVRNDKNNKVKPISIIKCQSL